MSRNLSANTLAALGGTVVLPIIFLEVAFDSGPIRLHTGYGNLTLNGNTYAGTGGLLEIGEVTENMDIASTGCQISLSAIDPAAIATFLQQNYTGRRVKLTVAFYAADGSDALLSSPYEFFSGRLDTVSLADGPDGASIAAQAESELADLTRSRVRRYTHAGAQTLNPPEMGFQFVEKVEERSILWGRKYRKGEPRPASFTSTPGNSGFIGNFATQVRGI